MSHSFIAYETNQGVATLVLNRPDVLNSFNRPMAQEVQQVLQAAATEEAVRVLVLTGAGRAFCAGQDLTEVLPAPGAPPADLGETVGFTYNPIIRALRHLEKPVVCAVNGVAAGAGANIALACDLVLASEKASFVQSFANIGLIPDSGGTFFLPRLVGLPRATAMMMLGEKIRAPDAEAMGLIYRCVSPDALMPEAMDLANRLAQMPTKGLGLTKRALNAAFTQDLDTHLDYEQQLQSEAGYSEDYNEGVQAFLEKRKPVFKGR